MVSPEQRTSEPAKVLVSIGLPVYNGENFLEAAVRSVLSQSLDDLQLVISDNASTDRTAEICRDYAAADRRVIYLRNETNLGAAPNYNRTFHESTGRYFKWLAHDDQMGPQYLERTVGALEARPEAVLCNSVVEYIDAQDKTLGYYDSGLALADRERPSDRFAAMILRSHSCVDFFGVQRRGAMIDSLLHGRFHGADRAYLAQIALRGRLVQLREPLLRMREHPGRYTRQKSSSRERLAWHDSRRMTRLSFPTFHLYGEYCRMVKAANLPPDERSRCWRVLTRWWFCNWNAIRVGVDVMAVFAPGVVGYAEHTKNRLFGAAPGHFLNANGR